MGKVGFEPTMPFRATLLQSVALPCLYASSVGDDKSSKFTKPFLLLLPHVSFSSSVRYEPVILCHPMSFPAMKIDVTSLHVIPSVRKGHLTSPATKSYTVFVEVVTSTTICTSLLCCLRCSVISHLASLP